MLDHELPAIFYDIAQVLKCDPLDIRDAVLAAFEAATPDLNPEEAQAMYRRMLHNLVVGYAAHYDLDPDLICDALVGAAQISEDDDGVRDKK